MENNDERVEQALREGAAKLDAAEVRTPDFMVFKALAEKQLAVVRRAQRRQLILFAAVAALLVSALLLCMGKSLVFIIALQAAAVAGAVVGLAVTFVRGKKLKAGEA